MSDEIATELTWQMGRCVPVNSYHTINNVLTNAIRNLPDQSLKTVERSEAH